MSTNDNTPPEGGEAPEPAGPDFSAWAPVFNDPSAVNPYELRTAYDWVQQLRGDGTHKETLTRALRDWEYIPQDVDLDYVTSLIEADQARRADPFKRPEPYVGGGYEAEPQFQENEGAYDPRMLRETWQTDMEDRLAKERAEIEADRQQMVVSMELGRQLDRVTIDQRLDPADREELWQRVQGRIQSGEVRPDQFESLVHDTYVDYNKWIDSVVARRAAAQEAANLAAGQPPVPVPTQPGSSGGTPGTDAPKVTSARDLARRTMDRVRSIEGADDIVD